MITRTQWLERQYEVTINIGANPLAGRPFKAPTKASGEADDGLNDIDDLSDLV